MADGRGTEPELPTADDRRTELEHDFLDQAKQFNWSSVKEMLEKTPDLINVQPAGRWTALHQAAYAGSADMVNFLVEKGADKEATNRSGQTPEEVSKGAEVRSLLTSGEAAETPASERGVVAPASDEVAAAAPAGAKEPPKKKPRNSLAGHTLNINTVVDKEYAGASFRELVTAPIDALAGIGPKGREVLVDKFKLKTIGALAKWKFYRVAKAMVELAPKEQEGKREEGSMMNLNRAMDKAYEKKSLKEILALKPSALQGLADWVDEPLAQPPLCITSIEKLGEFRFARWAESIVTLAEFETDGKSA